MKIVSEERFLETLEILKKKYTSVYNNPFSKKYINTKKAKRIIKNLVANENLNKFIISGFLEKYVASIYKNKPIIESMPEDNENKEDSDFYVTLSTNEYKEILSRIVIDDVHLNDNEIENGVQAYENLKKRKSLHSQLSSSLLQEYVEFVYMNRYQIEKLMSKKIDKIKMDSDNNYILSDKDFISRENCDGGHNSPLWICVNLTEENSKKDVENSRKNDIVVKNLLPENERETALIAEEIARQMRLPVAQYYPAKYIGTYYSKREALKRREQSESENSSDLIFMTDRIVLTPNFLKDGEELITGDRIAKYEMDISVVPDLIRDYMSKREVSEEEIQELISDYRTIMAFNCLINHRDCHNGNWGFIKDENGKYKMAHIFDLEGSLDENKKQIRAIYIGNSYSGDGTNIDKELLRNLLQDEVCRERMKELYYLNMNKVYNNVKLSKGITISKSKKESVNRVINKEKAIFESVFKEIYDKINAENSRNRGKRRQRKNYDLYSSLKHNPNCSKNNTNSSCNEKELEI